MDKAETNEFTEKALKRMEPKLSHPEQKKINEHLKVKIIVFQDPQSPHQTNYDERWNPKTKKCHYPE